MDPLTIAASITACKKIVETAVEVKDIGKALDTLWGNQQQHEHNKRYSSTPKATNRNQQVIRKRSGETEEAYGDTTSISSVASDVLQDKQNELALLALSDEIDKKWGKGTWDLILKERSKRLKARHEAKERAKVQAKIAKEAKEKFWHKVLIESGKGVLLMIMLGGIILGLLWAKTQGGS